MALGLVHGYGWLARRCDGVSAKETATTTGSLEVVPISDGVVYMVRVLAACSGQNG